jgi:hypothetical protein
MYVGTNASDNQVEAEPRFVQSEREYLSSIMTDDEITQSIKGLDRSLAEGALNGNMLERSVDMRTLLEGELQRRSQNKEAFTNGQKNGTVSNGNEDV